jgi:hypothetical protein
MAMLDELPALARSVVNSLLAVRRGEVITMPDSQELQQVAQMLLTRIQRYITTD